jgi:hypothetical protein
MDPYDRFWQSWSLSLANYTYPWISLHTNNSVISPDNGAFSLPSGILQRASTLDTNYSSIKISMAQGRNVDTNKLQLFLPIFHFAEINSSNTNRRFDIYINNVRMFSDFSPSLFQVESKYYSGQFMHDAYTFISLNKTASSSLPPLINAFELYSLVPLEKLTADLDDGKINVQVHVFYTFAMYLGDSHGSSYNCQCL